MSPVFDRKQPTMSSKSQQKSFKDEPKRVEHKRQWIFQRFMNTRM